MSRIRFSLGFLGLALLLLPFADLQIAATDPAQEFSRFLNGWLNPEVPSWTLLATAVIYTFSFGFFGTLVAAPVGFAMALAWRWRAIRIFCASLRAIHELFWALIFLQIFGLSPLTGLLAIALPYSAIFAKVFSEILEEQPTAAIQAAPANSSRLSLWLMIRLPQAWPQIRRYIHVRAECGLRSSAVLGFVGLPTLGYHLESALAYGAYGEAAVLLIALYLLIGGFRIITAPITWIAWLLILPFALPGNWAIDTSHVVAFFSQELIPSSVLQGDWAASTAWLLQLTREILVPGAWTTFMLSFLALAATGLLTLLITPLASERSSGKYRHWVGHGFLLVLRATPEYLLAYLLLQLWGPSMLPAIVALMLHNAALIAFLQARHVDSLRLRPDAQPSLSLYAAELLPRSYGAFLAWLFYRWEIILRESAVVGILGLFTLGFYIDSSLAELRLDSLLPLLVVTVLLNLLVEALSRAARTKLRLKRELTTRY